LLITTDKEIEISEHQLFISGGQRNKKPPRRVVFLFAHKEGKFTIPA